MLKPYPAEDMEAYPISTVVNNPRNETKDCIEAVRWKHKSAMTCNDPPVFRC